MMSRRTRCSTPVLLAVTFVCSPLPALAQGFGAQQQTAQERIDDAAIAKIKEEGFRRSQVMEITSWLTDVHGPRLTGSPISKRAGDWTVEQFRTWGLANGHYEWFDFGRGWTNERTFAQVTSPVPFPVIAYPPAWSDGTNGPVSAEVVYVPQTIRTPADFAPYRGKLRGRIVMTRPAPVQRALFTAPGRRYTTEELNAMSNPFPVRSAATGGGGGGQFGGGQQPRAQLDLNACFMQEGVAAILNPAGSSSTGGNVLVQSGGSRVANAPRAIPQLTLTPEHYGRIFRTLEKGVPVRMDLDVRNTFHNDELRSFNVIAEIPGTDKADEVVMLGAHFDSWHGGTGATDNAAGSAVMMEAMRILKASGLPLRRTVRIALWTGEEQGLIGSREYVTAHFGNRQTMELKPEHAKFSAYYNVDNGTGAIRGIYLQGNSATGPIFSQWMRTLNSDTITVGHVAPGNTGGTDHQSFDAVGLPGFQFIQDPVEYNSRTHHYSQDVYERIQEADMKHNAVVVATFVYLTANRDELMPRKPQPRAPAGSGPPQQQQQQTPVGCPAR